MTRRRVVVDAAPLREDVGVAVTRAPPPEEEGGDADLASLLGGGGLGGAAAGGQGDGALRSEGDAEGSTDRVRVAVTNFGNVPVENVVVRPRAGEQRLPRGSVGRLAPGETGSVSVDLSAVEGSATVVATANYTVAGTGPAGVRDADVGDDARAREGSASGRFELRRPAGEIRVTDVSLSFAEDGRLQVSGNAGNIGTAPVDGVVVSVGENEHVAPAYPGRSYFVGTVDGSEFAPFELTADVDAANATEIPVRVTYVVDGEERTRTAALPYDRSLESPTRNRGGLFSLGTAPLAGLGLGVALLVVGLPFVYLRRR